jgi:hypothetical protein
VASVSCSALLFFFIAIWAGVGCRDVAIRAEATPSPCRIHAVGKRLIGRDGHTVYRYPGPRAPVTQVKCSGRTIWALFHGGGQMSQEAYVGVRSGDAGRTWKVLLAEPYFGVKAPFAIDAYSGPWTIAGENSAYFVGWCPACGRGTVSLTVTRDGGRHFHRYGIPKLTGFYSTSIRVDGNKVSITGRNQLRTGPRSRMITIRVG